jgi:hypothetical protein
VEQTLQQPRPEGRGGETGGRGDDTSRKPDAADSDRDEEDDGEKRSGGGLFGMVGAGLKGPVATGQQAGAQAADQSPLGFASTALGAALKETLTRLVNTLRELLQTVKGLLQTVVALLKLVLVALREGVLAALSPIGSGLGGILGKVTGAATP